ncbi:protein of unknown function [Vibrio tapetis subsp. tapetis]|uniref:Uncharacterized protein n=1 Tax=Vibrio tapetis subsp. tapetis TaxID=1671868 RepID=A0A2N8ZJT0_9VIBR|nr:protein of unknown function [Vibrio tapetis subsp. tapetis]
MIVLNIHPAQEGAKA